MVEGEGEERGAKRGARDKGNRSSFLAACRING
jgi:hypothetical protein